MLTLYSTEGCHLCELAFHLLTQDVRVPGTQIHVVDIATDDQLIDRFGVLIPVLETPSQAISSSGPLAPKTLADT